MNIALLMHKVVKGCLDFLLHLFQKKNFRHPGHDYTNHTK